MPATDKLARLLRVALLVVAHAAWASAAAAHHGIVNFDMNREVDVSGVITRLSFVNPHSWLYFDVTGEDGRSVSWQCELRGATMLRRSGWTPEMFARGTRVRITGAPDRFKPNTCYLGTALFDDGTRVDRYGQITRPVQAPRPAPERVWRLPNGHPNIAGEWAAEQRVLTDPRGISGAFLPISVARDMAPGTVPEGAQAFPGTRGTAAAQASDPVNEFWNNRPSIRPLTADGARAIEGFDGASSDNPRLRCEPTNILFDWTFEADVNRIEQDGRRIVLRYGSMGLERTIHLAAAHPADVPRSRAGHSIGRWENDVLVVDTVGFEPGILSADGRLPHSDQLHVIERFTVDPDRRALTRAWVAADPRYFEGDYSGSDIVYISDVPYQATPCEDLSYKSSAGGVMATPIMIWSAAGVAGLVIGWMLKRRGRSRAAGTLAVLLALLPGPSVAAQTADQRFEVASIRVRQDTEAGRTGIEEQGGVVRIENLPLRALVRIAYGVMPDHIIGPASIDRLRFDVTAKLPEGYAPQQLPTLMRNLLTDRFGLVARREPGEVEGFEMRLQPGSRPLAQSTAKPGYLTGRPGLIEGTARPVSDLVRLVAQAVGRPVTDETGLTGAYDLKLTWTEELAPPALDAPGNLSIFTALREQMGLRLEQSPVTVDFVVIDRVAERPTDN